MAGMAWTLHPALLYEKFGPVLIELWESGAFRSLFRPVRHLSRTIGAAITPRRFNGQIEQPVLEEQSIDSVPTDDEALERANCGCRTDDESTMELSSTQQNELAFQGDIYIQQRRAKKQRERARKACQARQLVNEAESALQGGRRRRGSIIASTSGSPKRGRSRRRHSMSTPTSDAAGMMPLRKVKLDGISPGSPSSPGTEKDDELPVAVLKDNDSPVLFKMYKAVDGGKRSVGTTPPARSSPPRRLRRSFTQLYPAESSETPYSADRVAEPSRPPPEVASPAPVSLQNVMAGETEGCLTEGTTTSDSQSCMLDTGAVVDTLKEKHRKTKGARKARSKEKRVKRRRKTAQLASELPTTSDSLTMTQEGLQQQGGTGVVAGQPLRDSSGEPAATIPITAPTISSDGAEAAESGIQVWDARPVSTTYLDTSRSTSPSEAAFTSLLKRYADGVQEPGPSSPRRTFQSTPDEKFQGPFASLVELNLREDSSNRHEADSRTISAKELDKAPSPASVHRRPSSTVKRTVRRAKRASRHSESFSDQVFVQPRHRKHSHKRKAALEALESNSASILTESSPGSFSLSESGLQHEIEEQQRRKKKVSCMALVVADTIDGDLTSTAMELTSTAFEKTSELTAKDTQMTDISELAKSDRTSPQLDTLTSEQLFKSRSKSSTEKKSKYKGEEKSEKERTKKGKKDRKTRQSSEVVGAENAASNVKIGAQASGSEREQSSSAVGKQKKQKKRRPAETTAVAGPNKGAVPEPSTDAVSGPSKRAVLRQAAGSVPKPSKKAFTGKKKGVLSGSSAGTSVSETPTVECTSTSVGLRDDDFDKDSVTQSINGDVRLHVKASTHRKATMLWPFGHKPKSTPAP